MITDSVATSPGSSLTWNLVQDVWQLLDYEFMRNAFLAGGIVAIVAGAVGYFVVLRRLAFAGHALSHIGFAGATGAVLVAGNGAAVFGLLTFTGGAAAIMGALGARIRERDVVIGIVLAWTLGLGVLFLSLYRGYATEAFAILFGEVLGVSSLAVLVTLIAGVITLVALACIYRPLLFTSLDEGVAEARGVPVRALGVLFMILLALAVSEAVQVVGVLLIFSLLVTPAAIAERVTTRPPRGILIACALALLFTWLGLLIAWYVSAPPSFFITTLAFVTYLGVRAGDALRRSRRPRAVLEVAA